MAPRTCPIKFPYKCKACPLHPINRLEICKYYRKQIIAGVPWHWKADVRWLGWIGRTYLHPYYDKAKEIERKR